MKEDLNLIFTIDISQQSISYYRKHYTVIIQEALRAFEFKWDPKNIDNKHLRSRIQVYGISKPRKTIKRTKIFDTLTFNFGVNDEVKTGIEGNLNQPSRYVVHVHHNIYPEEVMKCKVRGD